MGKGEATKKAMGKGEATKKFPKLTTRDAFGFARHLKMLTPNIDLLKNFNYF